MSTKYQFRYQLPSGQKAIHLLVKETKEKIIQNYDVPNGIPLSLIEGLTFTIITGSKISIFNKLAYEPGKSCPCYAVALASTGINDRKIVFPYGGEDSRISNMYFIDSPNIKNFNPEEYHISDVINYHSPFLPEHKKDRYVGTASERADYILDLIGHLFLLQIDFSCSGGFVPEFYDWAFRAAGITQEEFFSQIKDAAKDLTNEENLNPFFEDVSDDKKAS